MEEGNEAKSEMNNTVSIGDNETNLPEKTLQENGPEKEPSPGITIAPVGSTETDEVVTSNKGNGASENSRDAENLEVLKEGTVQFHGANRVLQLTTESLRLQPATELPSGKKTKQHAEVFQIQWQDVIWANLNSKAPVAIQKTSFSIHYMAHQKTALKKHCVNLTANDEPADGWISAIQEQCAKVEGRPKKLFVVVNPIGGAGTALKIFQKKVSPILQLAQINADVVQTERARHALEIGENQDFSAYDGVMVVGGDGLYQEVLQGMAIQRQKAAGVDYNDINSKFVGLDKPIAIIPAGTGNGVAGWINGTKDMETAALRVVRGEIHRSQIFTIHSNGKFFCLCGLLFAYGAFADLIKRTEELRWMKRARYPYSVFGLLFKTKRRSHYQVEYCIAADSQESDNDKQSDPSEQESNSDWHWIKHDSQGREYVGVYSFIANPVDVGDHCIQDIFTDRFRLYVDMGVSSIATLKTLVTSLRGKKILNYPTNMEVMENVQGVRIKIVHDEDVKEEEHNAAMAKARDKEHYLDIDGECLKLDVPEMDIRVVPSFAPLYACKMT